ncbi:MAG: hypothetical protein HUK21_10475 [Fibrobacteraceae bacterium]|nr:hypothetical protein [Fibrobacteraceae bacterium]
MKKFFISISVLCAGISAAPLTWESLIQSADNDPQLQAADKRVGLVSEGSSTKLWNNLEFRYKMDGFSFAKHDFELRMKPKSFGESSSTRNYWNAQGDYQKARRNVEKSYLLYDRYERAFRYVNRRKIYELNQKLLQINTDRIEVLHIKSGSQNFNPEDLMTALEANAALRTTIISDSIALRDTELKLKSWVDFDSVELDSSYLPTMDELAEILQGDIQANESFPLVAMAKSKWTVNQERMKQENAGDRDYISHIGVGYSLMVEDLAEKYKDVDGDDVYWKYPDLEKDYFKKAGCTGWGNCERTQVVSLLVKDEDNRQTKDKFFLNVGIRLPFFDSDNDDGLRRQIAVLDAESDYLDEYRDMSQKVGRLVEEILSLVAQWKVQKEFVEQINAGKIFEQFAANAGNDPILLLRAQESAVDSDLKAVKLEYDIFSRYLVLLDYAGVFARENVGNHLRQGLK